MVSLRDRLDLLEADLLASPPRFALHADLPFAILRYDADREWELRREISLLATRLANRGRQVLRISLADLLWHAVDHSEGMEAIVELERTRGFEEAERQLTLYLSDPDFQPLPRLLEERLSAADPDRSVAFLERAAAMAPHIYPMSRLLEEMQGRTRVPTVLFYPGTIEGVTGLRFMGMEDREPMGNYRVKVYS